jgi:hypothetical protein
MTQTEAQNSISQAMGWKKTMDDRHNELVALRNQNSIREHRTYGQTDKERVIKPQYDVVSLDQTISKLAMELRKLDEAIKHTNNTAMVAGYVRDEKVLGELKPAAAAATA